MIGMRPKKKVKETSRRKIPAETPFDYSAYENGGRLRSRENYYGVLFENLSVSSVAE